MIFLFIFICSDNMPAKETREENGFFWPAVESTSRKDMAQEFEEAGHIILIIRKLRGMNSQFAFFFVFSLGFTDIEYHHPALAVLPISAEAI